MQLEKRNKTFLVLSSFFLIIVGIFLILYTYYKNYNKKEENEHKINNFFKETKEVTEEKNVNQEIITSNNINNKNNNNYIAVLEIKSINLNRGLVDKSSKYNKISYNIQILEKSDMPDKENGNFLLAGHNGNSNISFFGKLDKMKENDLINVYYNGFKYVYKYSYNYEILKTGNVNVVRDNNKTTITLITCKKKAKDKQIVYIGYLIDKAEY